MKISGQVVDIDNVPLAGANITLRSGSKAGKVGANADFDGNFNLESDVFDQNDTFEVSYMGFVTQSFKANELQDRKVTLKESLNTLDEVVIVGTKPKKSSETKSKLMTNLSKNKYAYAGVGGLLGLALIFLSIKKIK